MSNLVKNTLLVGVSEIASKGIIALAMILLVRTLATESYGLYSLAITLTYFFIGFLHSGFYTIGMREVAKYPELATKYVNNVTTLKIFLSLLSYVLLVVIVQFLGKPTEAKIAFYLAGLFLFILVFHIDWLFRGIDKMEITSLGSIMQGTSLLIFIYFFVKNPDDLHRAVVVYLGSWSIYIVFEVLVYFIQKGPIRFEYDSAFNKKLLKESLPISFSSLIIAIYANINVVVLNIYKGDYETGIYSAMIRLMNILLLPNSILQISFFPELSRSVLSGAVKLSQRKYLLVLFVIGFFVIFGMLGYSYEVIGFVFGRKYLVGDAIFKVSLIACFFSYLSASAVVVSLALGKQKNFFYATIVGVGVSLISNLILVPRFGAMGAVISLSITEFIVFFILMLLNRDNTLFEPYKAILKPLLVAFASFLCSKCIEIPTSSLLGLISYFLIFLILASCTKILNKDLILKLVKFGGGSD
jgi:O-antigen/teichoic acid export membrane protein